MQKICFWVFFLTFFACQSPNEAPRLLWKSAALGPVFIESIYPVFFEDKIIVSQSQENQPFQIYALDKKTGQTQWIYQDTARENAALYYNLQPYTFQNMILIPAANRLLAFDMRTGKLHWERTLHHSAEAFVEGLGPTAFRFYYDYAEKKSILYRINVFSGEYTQVWSLSTPENQKVFCRSPFSFTSSNRDTCLVFSSITQDLKTKETTAKIHWSSKSTPLLAVHDYLIYPVNFSGDGVTKQPILDTHTKTLFLVANQDLIAIDTRTQNEKWRKTMPRDMLTSCLQMDESRVFFPAEDGFLYALDKKNGIILWKTAISGTPSRTYTTPRQIHVVGGGDGLWHILDKATGKELFALPSPNRVNYSSVSFRRAFSVAPDGKSALTTDGKDFFYYEL